MTKIEINDECLSVIFAGQLRCDIEMVEEMISAAESKKKLKSHEKEDFAYNKRILPGLKLALEYYSIPL